MHTATPCATDNAMKSLGNKSMVAGLHENLEGIGEAKNLAEDLKALLQEGREIAL
jgi:hypothetical protein